MAKRKRIGASSPVVSDSSWVSGVGTAGILTDRQHNSWRYRLTASHDETITFGRYCCRVLQATEVRVVTLDDATLPLSASGDPH
jgi:hypothetical protein